MPDQPTPDLDAIEARADAATPGPWGTYTFGGDTLIEIAADLEDTGNGYKARRTIARFDEEPLDNDPAHREWTAEEDWAQVQADAAYIAAMSPEVAKALVAEARRLRAKLAVTVGERDCLAMAVLFATQWTPKAPMSLREGIDEVLATMPSADGAPDTGVADTFPAWLAQRFDPQGAPWEGMSDDDRAYWEHQARAVRRAAARGGFKTDTGPAASV
jgi:hypothetical protein